MANKYIRGYSEKQIYRNERFNRGVISTNDPLTEGSFNRLINFKISNQGTSLENREPFLTVPLFDKRNNEIKLSPNAFSFALNDSTEYAYILDLKQKEIHFKDSELYKPVILVKEANFENNKGYVIDGDTINYEGKRYRLAIIDTPELNDEVFKPIEIDGLNKSNLSDMGSQAKAFVEKELQNKSFNIIQYPFQSEFIDEFGREIVFIEYESKLLNLELFDKGLAMFYGQTSFENNKDYFLPEKIYTTSGMELRLSNEFKNIYENKKDPSYCFSETYTGHVLNIKELSNINYKYEKPILYKIKKETDLQNSEIKNNKFKIIKRVLDTIEINELLVKQDLEISNDTSLKYVLESKDFTIVNGKYVDQYINFYVNVLDVFNKSLYKGLIELTHSNENVNEGIKETFKLRTYNKTEAHIEIQDLTNYKPNILDSKSIIPKTYIGRIANSKGFTSPSVDSVLVNAELNYDLKFSEDENEKVLTQYFQTNSLINNDIKRYTIKPYFKAPQIFDKDENKNIGYMFRWDLINLKEIDYENLDEANPYFRSAWADLHSLENISENSDRLKSISLKKENLTNAEEIYVITTDSVKNFIEIVEDEEIEWTFESDTDIENLQIEINDLLEHKSLEQLKDSIKNNNLDFLDNETRIFKLNKNEILEIKNIISNNNEDDSISLQVNKTLKNKDLSESDLKNIFKREKNKTKKIAFIFLPIEVQIEDTENKINISTYNALETKGVYFEIKTKTDYTKIISPEIKLKDLIEKGTIEKEFFDEGIQATFYLMTYDKNGLSKMSNPDVFYDNMAYKKTTATYFFQKAKSSYKKEDFIIHELKKESAAIQKCRYLTSHEDKIVAYGNKEFANTIFISEEGAPYYFALVNIFEFDHEVVHVQSFKNILLVFTINDIWVIYQIEEDVSYQDKEGNMIPSKKVSYRYKKILYNISTEHKNKSTIKNITRYITLMSNDILYLIKPSTFIADETEFSLNILSKNIDSIVRDPLTFINQRLKYFGIFTFAKDYKLNLNATDNYIKIYYTSNIGNQHYTLILTYDILNGRWYEEDTVSFGHPERIYLLDSSTGYEMLTNTNGQLYLTYQTDKYKNMMLNEYSESYYDLSFDQDEEGTLIENRKPIKYYLDTGYLKLNEHFKKRFKSLLYTMKNIDSRKILFSYNFTIDDRQFHSNFEPTYTLNSSNEIIDILQESQLITSEMEIFLKMKQEAVGKDLENLEKLIAKTVKEIEESKSEIGTLDDFRLDFSNLEIGDIMTVKQPLLGTGRLPRVQMNFTTSNRFYMLSYGIIYSEQGSKNI